jgi:probable HAF family extracellular repeat protein
MRKTFCTLCIMAAITLATAHSQVRYTITDLGSFASGDSDGFGISANGLVTGWFRPTNTSYVYHAFLYGKKTIVDLDMLGSLSFGMAVNNSGRVVGYYVTQDGHSRSFLYHNGSTIDLGALPGGKDSHAFAINESGQIAGEAETPFGYHAFLYSKGTMADLGTLGGSDSYGQSINRSGQVAGISYLSGNSDFHAFLYSDTTMRDLGTLGGTLSEAYAVNAAGQVTGAAATSSSGTHAFLYSDGTMTDLGTLGGDSYGYGINKAGNIVGFSYLSDGTVHAFLYTASLGMTDLNALIPNDSGWLLQVARKINDKEQIVGYGVIHGQSHAFLLTPALHIAAF